MNFQVPNSCAKRLKRWRHIRKPYRTPGSLGPDVQAVEFDRLLPESVLASYAAPEGWQDVLRETLSRIGGPSLQESVSGNDRETSRVDCFG